VSENAPQAAESQAARCPVHPEQLAVGSCRRCGRFACQECASKVQERHCGLCPECAERANEQALKRRMRRWQKVVLGGAIAGPTALALVLAFMRRDLLEPMLDHWFGYLVVGASSLLVGTQAIVLFLFFSLFNRRAAQSDTSPTGPSVALSVASGLLCTLPVVFLVLFGPIVFRFVFVGVE